MGVGIIYLAKDEGRANDKMRTPKKGSIATLLASLWPRFLHSLCRYHNVMEWEGKGGISFGTIEFH